MDAAYVSASFGLLGAIVGGLTSFGSTWLSQHAQIKAQFRQAELVRRQKLFSDFITEASRLYGDALTHEKDDITNLVSLYAIIENMRLIASAQVLTAADNALKAVIEMYLSPNKTLREIGTMARNGQMNLLDDFGAVCRAELEKIPQWYL